MVRLEANVKREGNGSVDAAGENAKPLPRKSHPPGKFGNFAVKRDFPPGCGNRASHNLGNKVEVSQNTFGGTKRSRDHVDDEDCDKYVKLRKSELSGCDEKHLASRKKVEEVLNLFESWWAMLLTDMKAKSEMVNGRLVLWRVYVETAVTLRKNHLWVNSKKRLGPIPGIEIGDKFKWRAMLAVVGLHHQFWSGIDYMMKDGKHLATSVVDSGRVYDNRECPDVFIYSGHGGNPKVSKVKPKDQKPVRGNQALLNSIEAKTPVRVIRGTKCLSGKCSTSRGAFGYIYVGLYYVERYRVERGCYGKLVFKFSLRRALDQL